MTLSQFKARAREEFETFRAPSKINAIKYGRIAAWNKKFKEDVAFLDTQFAKLMEEVDRAIPREVKVIDQFDSGYNMCLAKIRRHLSAFKEGK